MVCTIYFCCPLVPLSPHFAFFLEKILWIQRKSVYLQTHHPINVSNRKHGKLVEHYIMVKRHTMLCWLAGWNYHTQLQVKDNAKFDATGMLKTYPGCVREGKLSLQRTLTSISAILRGCHSVRQLARAVVGLNQRTSRRWIPTFYVV